MASTLYYWDKKEGCLKEGYPPPAVEFPRYGEAPLYISDEMRPCRHPMTGQVIESRKAWAQTNKATGCIDCSEPIHKKERSKEEKDKDWMQAMEKAIAQVDSGTAPLSEAQREACKRHNEAVSKEYGIDANNILGRKNTSGKKRHRKH